MQCTHKKKRIFHKPQDDRLHLEENAQIHPGQYLVKVLALDVLMDNVWDDRPELSWKKDNQSKWEMMAQPASKHGSPNARMLPQTCQIIVLKI